MSEIEIWKPVVGFEDYYEVSNLGRVKAKGRWIASAISASGRQYRKPRILRGGSASRGYKNVSFCVHGIETSHLVQKLVMEAFGKPCPAAGWEINHKNGNKQDNRLDNLEWVTHIQNMHHAIENGLIAAPRGEAHQSAVLNNAQVIAIQALLATSSLTQRQIAKAFKVSTAAITAINSGTTWRHLGSGSFPIRARKRA